MKQIIFMLDKIKQFIIHHKHFFTSLLFVAVGVFFIGKTAQADIFTSILTSIFGFDDLGSLLSYAVAQIATMFVSLLGSLFVMIVSVLISIAQFNHFIDLSIVQTGWGLTRDIANMFFIVVLLIIAFSTVLKISSYHYQKTLFKLIIMAVLVNFSKLIAGFLIDFFQVIMLTFVNGFKDVLGGNFAEGFGLYKMLSLASDASSFGEKTDLNYYNIAIASVIAVILLIVANMTVLIMAAVLLWRIAMLWVLIIISPLAYLSYAFMPKYWSEWWQMFFQHLVSGPVIAFFLWLSLLTIQQENIADKFNVSGNDEQKKEKIDAIFSTNINNELLLQYMVMLALLMGGLTISQKIAAQSGSAVGSFAQKVQKVGTRAAMLGTGVAAAGWALKKAPGYLNELQAGASQKLFGRSISLNYKDWKVAYDTQRQKTKQRRLGQAQATVMDIGKAGFVKTFSFYNKLQNFRSGRYGSKVDNIEKNIAEKKLQLASAGGLSVGYRKDLAAKLNSETKEKEKLETEEKDFINKRTKEKQDYLETNSQTMDEDEIHYYDNKFDKETDDLNSKRKNEIADKEKNIASISKQLEKSDNELDQEVRDDLENQKAIMEVDLQANMSDDERKKLEEQLGSINAKLAIKPLTDEQKTQLATEIKNMGEDKMQAKKKQATLYTKETYYRDLNQRKNEAEKMQEIKYEENSDVLLQKLMKAVGEKDTNFAGGIATKMTMDGNINDMVKGFNYDSGNYEEFTKFIDEVMVKQAGYTPDEGKRLASDLGYMAEKHDQWTYARAVTQKDGKRVWATKEEQALAVTSEFTKKEGQVAAKTMNRLSLGGEDADGNYHVNAAGMAILKEVGDKMIKHIDRMQNKTIDSLYEYNQRTGMLDKAANNGDLNAEFLQLLKHQYEKKSGAQPLPKTVDVIFKNYPDL